MSVLSVFGLAMLTSVLLAILRRWTTDQERLGRAVADKRRQRELIRAAKARGDREAVGRHRATLGAIAVKLMCAEGRPLLAAILPIAFVGTWAWYRLGHLPPRADEPVVIQLALPPGEIGELAWLQPQKGVRIVGPVVREVETGTDPGPAHGVARWTVSAAARPGPYPLTIRSATGTYIHPHLVGQRTYAPPVVFHDPDGGVLPQTEARLAVPPICGLIPGPGPADWGGFGSFFPAWVITYIVFVLPLFILGKRVLRLH